MQLRYECKCYVQKLINRKIEVSPPISSLPMAGCSPDTLTRDLIHRLVIANQHMHTQNLLDSQTRIKCLPTYINI